MQIALAPCSPFSVTTSLMRATAKSCRRAQVRLHTHLAETEDENRYCEKKYGCRPLDYLESAAGSPTRTWLAHGIHFNVREMRRLAKAGVFHQPLRLLEPDAGLGLLSGVRPRSRRRRRWAWR